MKLLTAKQYVEGTGIVETGRLLTNRGTISPTGDTKSDYESAMFKSGSSDNDLKDDVKTDLNRLISDAQTNVEPQVRKLYVWPLEKDGFEVQNIPSQLKRIMKDITRFYLHDEDVPDRVSQRYEEALRDAKNIGAGDIELEVDKLESTTLYTI